MSDLMELAAKIEAAAGPDRELDKAIALALFDREEADVPGFIHAGAREAYVDLLERTVTGARFTASLDAAMTLVPEAAGFSVQHMGHPCLAFVQMPGHAEVSSDAATPALALCAAALRARAAIHDDKGK